MPHYVFAYHGGTPPSTPQEGEKIMAAWKSWMADLGDKLINPGHPVGKSYTVSNEGVEDNGGPNPLMGYSVIEADDIEAALEIARGAAHLMSGGSIEVAEQVEISM